MTNNVNTLVLKQSLVVSMIAAGMDLDEHFPQGWTIEGAETVTAKPVTPKADKRNKEARAHNYAARINRRETTALGGLTKVERGLLAAILREELGREFTKEEWADNVAAYKAGEFTLADLA